MNQPPPIVERRIYTIAELTADIKVLLEEQFPFIWISGEISNFRVPASGHFYFTLKDSAAQIHGVMFKGQNRNLTFVLEDGMKITGLGRVSVYSPRGEYQIILEYIEPAGAGALQAAFEQLKRKLSDEGLFDPVCKKPIPFLPDRVIIISSPTGAVVHDIIRVVHRRFPGMPIEIIPVKVQGDGAAAEIVAGIQLLNAIPNAQVAIIARGGGSLEDLSPFNSEAVARAIFASPVPIISAVGHETDFTIADFVADLRAPTPSAAAELVVPVKTDLAYALHTLTRRLKSGVEKRIQTHRLMAEKLSRRLVHPRRRLDDLKLRVDDFMTRLVNATRRFMDLQKERLNWRTKRLHMNSPAHRIVSFSERRRHLHSRLAASIEALIRSHRSTLTERTGRMQALSPTAVLSRGYSITRTIPDKTVVTDAGRLACGQTIEILLWKGSLICRIERKDTDVQKNV